MRTLFACLAVCTFIMCVTVFKTGELSAQLQSVATVPIMPVTWQRFSIPNCSIYDQNCVRTASITLGAAQPGIRHVINCIHATLSPYYISGPVLRQLQLLDEATVKQEWTVQTETSISTSTLNNITSTYYYQHGHWDICGLNIPGSPQSKMTVRFVAPPIKLPGETGDANIVETLNISGYDAK